MAPEVKFAMSLNAHFGNLSQSGYRKLTPEPSETYAFVKHVKIDKQTNGFHQKWGNLLNQTNHKMSKHVDKCRFYKVEHKA